MDLLVCIKLKIAFQWKCTDEKTMTGFKGSMKMKSGKGERLILNHFGSKDGFISNALDLFVANTTDQDYHSAMDHNHYHTYIRDFLGPNLPDKCFVVIDQATYHGVKTDSSYYPKISDRKQEILNWLVEKGLGVNEELEVLGKAGLLDIVGRNIPEQVFEVDNILTRIPHSTEPGRFKDVKVLRQPVRHCFFNPIELIWAYIKGRVAKENSPSNSLQDVKKLTEKAIEEIPPDYWNRCYQHVLKVMKDFRESGRYIKEHLTVDKVVVPLNDDTDSDPVSETDDENTALYLQVENFDESDLDLDTDDEIDVDENIKSQQEKDVLMKVCETVAADQETVWERQPTSCGCTTTGCRNKQCSCRSAGEFCNPTCKCSDCMNTYSLPPGFDVKTTTTGQKVPEISPLRPVSERPRKKSKTYGGKCRCSQRSCESGWCICVLSGKLCSVSCECNESECQNRRKLNRVTPSWYRRMQAASDDTSGAGPSTAPSASPPASPPTSPPAPGTPPSSTSVFDFDE